MRTFRTGLFLLVLYAARTAAASGQDVVPDGAEWASEVRVLGANALIGGTSAGLVALLRGETPGEAGRAIARGAAGDPFASWVGRRIPSLEALLRHLEFNLVSLGAAVLLSTYAWPLHEDQPWEQEATYLGRSR